MAPRTSQIPLLNPDWPEDAEEKQQVTYFKDTDTKYIRLAKQGGIPGENILIILLSNIIITSQSYQVFNADIVYELYKMI